jgi:hypothetical protein
VKVRQYLGYGKLRDAPLIQPIELGGPIIKVALTIGPGPCIEFVPGPLIDFPLHVVHIAEVVFEPNLEPPLNFHPIIVGI